MKERIYNSTDEMFCPNCHKKIHSPFDFKKIKVTGDIRLNCGVCKNGMVIVKGQIKEEKK